VKNITASNCTFTNSFVDPSDLTGSLIQGGSSVIESNVTYSNVTNSTIYNSNIQTSSITNSLLDGVTLVNVTLDTVYMNGTTLTNSQATNSNVTGSAISNATITKADPALILDVVTATDTDSWIGVTDEKVVYYSGYLFPADFSLLCQGRFSALVAVFGKDD